MEIRVQYTNGIFVAKDDEWGCSVTLSRFTRNPQRVVYDALHTCHEEFGMTEMSEERAGEVVVNRLLNGNKGHYSCLEFPHIVLGVKGYSISAIAQARTHRHLSFAVRSYRLPIDKVDNPKARDYFLYRKPGAHKTRDGIYRSTEEDYEATTSYLKETLALYWQRIEDGLPAEHARELLPSCTRQDMQIGGNLRAFLHFLDLRLKANAQFEITHMSQCIYELLSRWCPQIMQWYKDHRLNKGLLAP